MKHESIAPNLVSDPESAAHTGLDLSMGLLRTAFRLRFRLGLGFIDDMIDAKIDHPHRPHSSS